MTNNKRAQMLLEWEGVAEALGGHIGEGGGNLWIQRAATQRPFYRIVRRNDNDSGESVKGANAYTSGELVAFLEGVRFTVAGF